ncbi:hypothetical protein ACQ94N_08095, partial [Escherichia coli]
KRAYCLKTQPATGETYPKSDLFNKAVSISNEGADTYLFGPGIDDSVDLSRYSPELDSHGQYSLPASGKYELRVLQTRNDARKNKTKKYNVDIQIK